MNRTACLLLGLVLLVGQINGQTFQDRFNALLTTSDTAAQRHVLEEWEAAADDDAALYIAYFNYFVNKSRTSLIQLGDDPAGQQSLELFNEGDTVGEPVAFMYSVDRFDPDLLHQGLDWIEQGIAKFPDRLDMRFGKIHMYGLAERYAPFTTEIIRTVERSAVNGN